MKPLSVTKYFSDLEAENAALAKDVKRMRHRIECLRGGLKSASGWFRDLDDTESAEKCLKMAGDMEPQISSKS